MGRSIIKTFMTSIFKIQALLFALMILGVTTSFAEVNEAPTTTNQTVSIPENIANGTVVATVVGLDDVDNVDDTDSIRFSFATPQTIFAIDAITGVITILNNATINYESTPQYLVRVDVTDKKLLADPNALITINVTNINERPTASGFTETFPENTNPHTSTQSITFTDPDVGDTPNYIITDNDGGPFIVNANGTITANGPLDFETKAIYTLTVQFDDQGGLPNPNETVTVIINVADSNEQPTVGPQTFTVPENSPGGTAVLTGGVTTASDPDLDNLVFNVVGGTGAGLFEFNPGTNQIVVSTGAALNFEVTPTYTLFVTVTDDGAPPLTSAQTTITINLTNVNEDPTIVNHTITIPESTPVAASVYTIPVTDPDAGDTHTFAIISGNTDSDFTLNVNTGEITVANPLDLERTAVYTILVQVTDAGGLTGTATITINIANVNEAPTIGDDVVGIPETIANGTSVIDLTNLASDPDAGDILTYTITGGNGTGVFTVNPTTGLITILDNTTIDYETTPTYTLTVRVTDAGGLWDEGIITVNVSNNNDYPWINPQTVTIPEDTPITTAIFTYVLNTHAGDPDVGTILTYTKIGGDLDNHFVINPATGVVTVQASLDFETKNIYVLTIRVTDNNVLPLNAEAILTINITDVEEAPVVIDGAATIPEDTPNGTVVWDVEATDSDNDILTYAITSGDPTGAFTINPTNGIISVNDSDTLDFETTPLYTLGITVTDNSPGALTGTGTVLITITDVEEAPEIYPAGNCIPENSPLGFLVYDYDARDSDGDNLTFTITGGPDMASFAIAPATGVITVLDPTVLDYDARITLPNPDFVIEVTVTDNSPATLSTTVQFTICLTNVAEPPVASDIDVWVAEDEIVGTIVLVNIPATDSDGDILTYLIQTGNTNSDLTMNQFSGEIRTANTLDYERDSVYHLTTLISESLGSLNTTITVHVHVINVWENPVVTPAVLSIVEFAPPTGVTVNGATVHQVVATDSDDDIATYAILTGNTGNAFIIDPLTGLITVNNESEINYDEGETVFQLLVRVTDAQNLTGDAVITINIMPVNEPPIVLIPSGFTVDVEENSPINFPIYPVPAIDPDGDIPTYELQYQGVGGPDMIFTINSITGWVSVLDSARLNYEPLFTAGENVIMLVVGVKDADFTAFDTLLINVIDINDIPVAEDDYVVDTVRVGGTLSSIDVLSNDSDEDFIHTLSVTITEPTNTDIASVNADNTISFTPNVNMIGTYEIHYNLIDDQGASDDAIVYIIVERPQDIVVYSGLSPNGDGLNDYWYIDNISAYPTGNVKVYNRWGNLVYEMDNYNGDQDDIDTSMPQDITKIWDGNSNTDFLILGTNVLPDGNYTYVIDLKDGRDVLRGVVVLKR